MLCALLALLVVASSALLRFHKSGLGCTPWPACQAQAAAQASVPGADGGQLVAAARLLHRVAASLVLVIALLAVAACAGQPALRGEMGLAVGLLVLVLALAALGAVTAGSRERWVALGNLLGGFAVLALSTRLAWPRLQGLAPGAWVLLAGVLLALQLMGGANASIGLVALEPGLPWGLQLHMLGAALVMLAWLPIAAQAWRRRPRDAALLAVLLVVQAALGWTAWRMQLPLAVAWLHNLGAAFVVVLGLRLVR